MPNGAEATSGTEATPPAPSHRLRLLSAAALVGGALVSLLYVWLLTRQRSSTAGIGLLALPCVFAVAASGSGVLALCGDEVARTLRLRRPTRGAVARAGIAAAVLIAALFAAGRVGFQALRLQRLQSESASPAFLSGSVDSALERRSYLELAAIAGNAQTPAEALLEIASSPDPGLHRKRSGVLQLLDRDALAVMRKLLRNPNVPAEAIPLIARSEDPYVLGDVAMNAATPVPLLRELAGRSDSYLVRWGLAWNPNTPVEILQSLAAMEYAEDAVLQRNLARNPSVPASVLSRLTRHPDPFVRRLVARNPAVPIDAQQQLARDEVEEVRFYLAINAAANAGVLDGLTGDESERVRRHAQQTLERRARRTSRPP